MKIVSFLLCFYGTPFRISNVSMETAVKADHMPLAKEPAHHIEKCLCPGGYAGLSCQVWYVLVKKYFRVLGYFRVS